MRTEASKLSSKSNSAWAKQHIWTSLKFDEIKRITINFNYKGKRTSFVNCLKNCIDATFEAISKDEIRALVLLRPRVVAAFAWFHQNACQFCWNLRREAYCKTCSKIQLHLHNFANLLIQLSMELSSGLLITLDATKVWSCKKYLLGR